MLVIAIAVVATVGIVGYYGYQGYRYVSTDDARIASNVVSVSPEIAGKILEWRVKEGDMVQKDDVLGRQDLGAAPMDTDDPTANTSIHRKTRNTTENDKGALFQEVNEVRATLLDRCEARGRS